MAYLYSFLALFNHLPEQIHGYTNIENFIQILKYNIINNSRCTPGDEINTDLIISTLYCTDGLYS